MPIKQLECVNTFLKQKILTLLPEDGRILTEVEGMAITRVDHNSPPTNCFYKPMIAVVLQGFKRSMIGHEEYFYGDNHCMVVGVDLPGVYHITDASPDEPFLSISLELNKYVLSQLLAEMPSSSNQLSNDLPPVVTVANVSYPVLNAFLRLVELLDDPASIPILAPMYIREIHYHLLNSVHGDCLRMANSSGTKTNQIAKAINWLRENYVELLDVERLAKSVNMSGSTFHRHFRQVTTFSPLQFQKQLRLFEAERLMLQEGKDVKTVAFQVGYESPSQFSREYKRQFGEAPYRDVVKKRA